VLIGIFVIALFAIPVTTVKARSPIATTYYYCIYAGGIETRYFTKISRNSITPFNATAIAQ